MTEDEDSKYYIMSQTTNDKTKFYLSLSLAGIPVSDRFDTLKEAEKEKNYRERTSSE